jgi:hypothetical protein
MRRRGLEIRFRQGLQQAIAHADSTALVLESGRSIGFLSPGSWLVGGGTNHITVLQLFHGRAASQDDRDDARARK